LAVHGAEALMIERPLRRPRCPYCTHAYAPVQWSAIAAYLTGRRHCEGCGRPVRPARLAGELFVVGTWALLGWRFGLTLRVVYAMLALLPLAMVMVTDLETKRIPHLIMMPSIGLMLILGTIFGPALPRLAVGKWWYAGAGALIGFGVFRLLVWLGTALFGEGALGEGDMTLATYAGAVVGFPVIIETLVVAFFLGGVGAVVVLVTRRDASLQTAIPYGPFIVLGAGFTLIWGPEIIGWFL
jgi:leader peptidase (prepilin peptidase)/N-methyltransferase